MAVAVAMCMATIAFTDGTFSKLFHVMVEQQLGHLQVHHPDYPGGRKLYDTVPDASATLDRIEAVDSVVAAAAQLNGFALIGGESESAGGQLVGVEPARERAVTQAHERIVEGRFLSDEPAQEIVLGVGLAEDIEVGLGDSVVAVTQAADGSLGNALYDVVGLFRTGNTALDKSGSMMHLADLQSLLVLDDQVHKVTILGTDADALEALKGEVAAVVPDGAEVETWSEASPQAVQMMSMQSVSSGIVLVLVFAVASFGVLNTMMMSVFERTRELGVLKAIGMRPARMVELVMVESLFLGLLAGAMGLVLGGLLDLWLVTKGFDMSAGNPEGMTFNGVTLDPVLYGEVRVAGIVQVIGALLAVSLLASIYPAWRASRLDPVDALRAD
jgi:ABC-type lipoprotein release transport system permease subunit